MAVWSIFDRIALPGAGAGDGHGRWLETHLQYVEATHMAIDDVHNLALVDENIVELGRSGRRITRHGGHKCTDFLGPIWIGDVVSAQAPVEERTKYYLVRVP